MLSFSFPLIGLYIFSYFLFTDPFLTSPKRTVTVPEGSDVVLTWQYLFPYNKQPEVIWFGIWSSTVFISQKLIIMKASRTLVSAIDSKLMTF